MAQSLQFNPRLRYWWLLDHTLGNPEFRARTRRRNGRGRQGQRGSASRLQGCRHSQVCYLYALNSRRRFYHYPLSTDEEPRLRQVKSSAQGPTASNVTESSLGGGRRRVEAGGEGSLDSQRWKKLGASEAGGREQWVQLGMRKDTVGYGEGSGFGKSGPAGKQQPGPRMGEGGESQDTEPF